MFSCGTVTILLTFSSSYLFSAHVWISCCPPSVSVPPDHPQWAHLFSFLFKQVSSSPTAGLCPVVLAETTLQSLCVWQNSELDLLPETCASCPAPFSTFAWVYLPAFGSDPDLLFLDLSPVSALMVSLPWKASLDRHRPGLFLRPAFCLALTGTSECLNQPSWIWPFPRLTCLISLWPELCSCSWTTRPHLGFFDSK